MRKGFCFLVSLVLSIAAAAPAQTGVSPDSGPTVGTFSTINVPLLSTFQPARATVQLVGNPGPRTAFYWIVVNYPIGPGPVNGPFVITNAPNAPSVTNYLNIYPTFPDGSTSIDVLRTLTPVPPKGTCNCAVVTGLTSGFAQDQTSATGAYVVANTDANLYNLSLANEVQGTGSTHLILRQNGVQVADLSSSGAGTITGVTAGVGMSGGGVLGNVTLNWAPGITPPLTYNAGTGALNFLQTFKTGQYLFAVNGSQPNFLSPVLTDGNNGATVSGAGYAIACDGATNTGDRGKRLRFVTGASVPVVPDSTLSACGGLFVRLVVESGGPIVFTRANASDVFNINNGTGVSLAQTGFTLQTGQYATLTNDNTNLWSVDVSSNGATPLSSITAAGGSASIANGNFPIVWNWAQTTVSQNALTIGESSAATGAGDDLVQLNTLSGSLAIPLNITQGSVTGSSAIPALNITSTFNTSGNPCALCVSVTNTASGASAALMTLKGGAAGNSTIMLVQPGGPINISSSILGIANTTNLTFSGGLGTASVNGAVGNGTFSGSSNSNAGGSTAAGTATLQAGSLTGTPTNLAGAVASVVAGTGTGNAAPATIFLDGGTKSTASGTAAQTQVHRQVVNDTKTLSTTNTTATTVLSLNVGNSQGAGAVIRYTIIAKSATDTCSLNGVLTAVAETNSTATSKGAIGTNTGTDQSTVCTGADTLAATFAITSANPAVVSVTPTWATIVPTSVYMIYSYDDLSDASSTL